MKSSRPHLDAAIEAARRAEPSAPGAAGATVALEVGGRRVEFGGEALAVLAAHLARGIERTRRAALEREVELGHVLVSIKRGLPHGTFRGWVARCGVHERLARRAMVMARTIGTDGGVVDWERVRAVLAATGAGKWAGVTAVQLAEGDLVSARTLRDAICANRRRAKNARGDAARPNVHSGSVLDARGEGGGGGRGVGGGVGGGVGVNPLISLSSGLGWVRPAQSFDTSSGRVVPGRSETSARADAVGSPVTLGRRPFAHAPGSLGGGGGGGGGGAGTQATFDELWALAERLRELASALEAGRVDPSQLGFVRETVELCMGAVDAGGGVGGGGGKGTRTGSGGNVRG